MREMDDLDENLRRLIEAHNASLVGRWIRLPSGSVGIAYPSLMDGTLEPRALLPGARVRVRKRDGTGTLATIGSLVGDQMTERHGHEMLYTVGPR